MSSLRRQNDLVKESLSTFVQHKMGGDPLSAIDDIVVSYMTSILEDVGTQADFEEQFDSDEFIEMMGAYFPGFTEIESGAVTEWLFDLATKLSQMESSENKSEQLPSSPSLITQPQQPFIHLYLSTPDSPPPVTTPRKTGNPDKDESIGSRNEPQAIQTKYLANGTNSFDKDTSEDSVGEVDKQVELLQEMFGICVLEATQCLSIAKGDTERAAQLVMHRLDTKECLSSSTVQIVAGKKCRKSQVDDKELKEQILSKYAFVDQAEDKREHKPAVPKAEPKKLIRYRDNRIVSLKGERFSEIQRTDEEDATTKKSSVANQKPAKSYRFN